MKRVRVGVISFLILGLFGGCAFFPKKDEPPPLPPIEETKPPLSLKGDYFKAFPWDDLPKPMKDGNDPDTYLYTVKEGDTLESIAEKEMGDPALAAGLASYNQLSSPAKVEQGQKIVIPYPIIGLTGQLIIKAKGEKEFSPPKPFTTTLNKGDQYKMRFVSNVNGYLYVFREGPDGVVMLYPAKTKPPPPTPRGRKPKPTPEPVVRQTAAIRAHEAVLIPTVGAGFAYDQKRAGDRVYVFLSLRKITALEDLLDKKKITAPDIEEVMREVRIGDIYNADPPYNLLRISDPAQILGIRLNLTG
ncbi:MAG: LysM peptidoglycan-binding domain-containing protein [Desulfomonile sp.]|nr:LysM peptidoglycan-binding domain-containing protein [Desulfomonile sp.]